MIEKVTQSVSNSVERTKLKSYTLASSSLVVGLCRRRISFYASGRKKIIICYKSRTLWIYIPCVLYSEENNDKKIILFHPLPLTNTPSATKPAHRDDVQGCAGVCWLKISSKGGLCIFQYSCAGYETIVYRYLYIVYIIYNII